MTMISRRRLLAALLVFAPVLFSQAPPSYDLVIKGGRVLDGAGNPWFAADIPARRDRIARIGRLAALVPSIS